MRFHARPGFDLRPSPSVFAGLESNVRTRQRIGGDAESIPLARKQFAVHSDPREASTGTSFGTVGLVVSDAMIVDAGQRLAAAARSPARVVLFGSRARGDAREDSDLDFLVIEEHLDSKLSEMVRLRDALPPLAVPVDVVVVSEEEVARRSPVPSTLVHRALREGRILVPA